MTWLFWQNDWLILWLSRPIVFSTQKSIEHVQYMYNNCAQFANPNLEFTFNLDWSFLHGYLLSNVIKRWFKNYGMPLYVSFLKLGIWNYQSITLGRLRKQFSLQIRLCNDIAALLPLRIVRVNWYRLLVYLWWRYFFFFFFFFFFFWGGYDNPQSCIQ